jgi:hypothetical protein
LAKASLADQGIHNPTPEQIKAALNGGTITTKSGEQVKLDGVLKMRASGMGWGEIAHKLGFKLGELTISPIAATIGSMRATSTSAATGSAITVRSSILRSSSGRKSPDAPSVPNARKGTAAADERRGEL